jgi:hypothetical protein
MNFIKVVHADTKFVLGRLVQKMHEYNFETHVLFADYVKVF